MTYSPTHIADGQHLTVLLDTLERDLIELRQMASIYEDAVTMPGRRPDVDPDGTGRAGTHDPSRPTENIALDSARAALQKQLETGISHTTYAIAYVRGATASMDRALSHWEGEAVQVPGEQHERTDGAALDTDAGGQPSEPVALDGSPAPAQL